MAEEIQTTQSLDTTPESSEKAKAGKRSVIFLALGAILFLFVLVVGAFVLLSNNNKKGDISLDVDNANNSIEAMDLYARNTALTVLNAIDFSKLKSDSPADFINFDEVVKNISEAGLPKNYIQNVDFAEVAGKTMQNTLDLDLNISMEEQPVSITLSGDLYVSYPENAGELFGKSYDLSVATSQEFQKQIIENVNQAYELTFAVDAVGYKISGDLSVSIVEGVAYIVASNLVHQGFTLDQQNMIENFEDKVFSADLVAVLNEADLQQSQASAEVMDPQSVKMLEDLFGGEFKGSDTYKELNTQLKDMADADRDSYDIYANSGNKIVDEVKYLFRDVPLFTSISKYEPSVSLENSVCHAGKFNFEGLADRLPKTGIAVIDILLGEDLSSSDKQDLQMVKTQIEENADSIPMMLSMVNPKLEIVTCSDSDTKTSTGVGLSANFAIPFTGEFGLKFSSFTVDSDSDYDISTKIIDVDLTDQVVGNI